MAARGLSRRLPRVFGGPAGVPRSVATPPQDLGAQTGTPNRDLGPGTDPEGGTDPERARLRGREERDRRRRRREEREQGKPPQAPPAPQKSWTPKAELEYRHPLEPDGKKATGVPLPPSYSPRYVEAAWYQWWERVGVFRPPEQEGPGAPPVLSLVLPPPNVTGTLHLGHALGVALQDVLVRWRRMQGWNVLWVPGTDHAGIATQAIVERWLWLQRGLRRQDLTREQFLEEVWAWKRRHGDEILGQLRALGASLDWTRCCFTMDPGFSRAVSEAFVRLFRAGLIRRERRLVSWSCALRSALADVEVSPRALTGPTPLSVPGCPRPVTFGLLVTFAYPVEGDDGLEVPVSTTRPETLFGDVAVAVHPRDPRYAHLHGRRLQHPFTGRVLPLITDPSVDPELGTGAVKVTPGHSAPDLALARTHGLTPLSVIAEDGTLRPPGGGWLQGVPRFEARSQVVAALAQQGLFRGVQDHAMTLPLCSRSGDVVEQLLKPQWFLSCEGMAQEALKAVTSGRLRLVPKFHEKNWKSWMENVGDWCLSRQLWWGHQIPAYRVLGGFGGPKDPRGGFGGSPKGEEEEEEEEEEGPWFVGRSEDEARAEAAAALGRDPRSIVLRRDPDVLDTWFSSALFPFAALGWPQQTPDLRRFFPSSVLVTGGDLLFFWVGRMVLLGQHLTGLLPFQKVLLHSLVRDSRGRKMSKSLGNVVDPRDFIGGASLQELQEKLRSRVLDPPELEAAARGQEQQFPHGIPPCGADALRLALLSQNCHGPEIRVDLGEVLSQRRFCNKVWNGLRFVLGVLRDWGGGFRAPHPEQVLPTDPMERWILSRLSGAVSECHSRLESLEFHLALGAVQGFWLRSFCDVFLEASKPSFRPSLAQNPPDKNSLAEKSRDEAPPGGVSPKGGVSPGVLLVCAELGLRLLGPFAPFVAEELWQRLPRPPNGTPTLCKAPFPDPQRLAHWRCPEAEAQVSAMLEVVRALRGLRETFRLGGTRPQVLVRCPERSRRWLQELGPAFRALSGAGSVRFLPPGEEPGPGWVAAPAGEETWAYLGLQGLPDPGHARDRLRARARRVRLRLHGLGPAPGHAHQHQVAILEAELSRLERALEALEPLGDPPKPPPGQ